jgi:perosamine synthetase
MLLTDDPVLAERARTLRAHGMSVSDLARHTAQRVVIEEYEELGYNYRMTDMQAAIGIEQLKRLDGMIERRCELARRYDDALRTVEGVQLPLSSNEIPHTYQSYMIQLTPESGVGREALMQHLLAAGIATRRGVMAIHLEPYYRQRVPGVRLPVTEAASRETVLLPIYGTMTTAEQDYVIEHLLDALAAGGHCNS